MKLEDSISVVGLLLQMGANFPVMYVYRVMTTKYAIYSLIEYTLHCRILGIMEGRKRETFGALGFVKQACHNNSYWLLGKVF